MACASPALLAAEGAPREPEHLLSRQTIVVSTAQGAPERWSFNRDGREIVVPVRPRLVVSSVQAALDAAVASGGFVRPLSYQSEPLEEAGLLRRVLTDFEPPPIPIHLVYPAGSRPSIEDAALHRPGDCGVARMLCVVGRRSALAYCPTFPGGTRPGSGSVG